MGDIVYQGVWDCSKCFKTRNEGRECSQCGEPHDPLIKHEQWYLPENAKVITDPEVLKYASLAPWSCGRCGVLNEGDRKTCRQCNRPLDGDDTVHRTITYGKLSDGFDELPDPDDERIEDDREAARRIIDTNDGARRMGDLDLSEDALPRIGSETELSENIRRRARAKFAEPGSEERDWYDRTIADESMHPFVRLLKENRHKVLIGVGGLVIVAVVIGLISMLVSAINAHTATKPGTVTVTALHWRQDTEIEALRTLDDGGWNHPADARIQRTENRVSGYRTIHDGWRTIPYTDLETRYKTESYMADETRYKTESYMGSDTRYRSVQKSRDCSYTSMTGGKYTRVSRTCYDTVQESYSVPAQKTRQVPYTVKVPATRQVPYQVPVPKTRQEEITHQEPVYATWYVYQVDRWQTARYFTATDTTPNTLLGGSPNNLVSNNLPGDQPGEERVGKGRTTKYIIEYVDMQGVPHSETSDYDDVWKKLAKNQVIQARYYERNGSLANVEWRPSGEN